MKTKKQILEHLSQVGYAKTETPKIAGWLVAKEIAKVGEKIVYTDGEKSFKEFLDWYEGRRLYLDELVKFKNKKNKYVVDIKDFYKPIIKEYPIGYTPFTILNSLLEPTKEEKEIIKKFNTSLEQDSKDVANLYFRDINNRLHLIPKPKFKVGDKVKLNQKSKQFTITSINNKNLGGYRYEIECGTEKCHNVRECKLSEVTKVEEPIEPKFKVGDWVRWIGFEDARKNARGFYHGAFDVMEDNVFQVVDIDKDTKYISISKEVMKNIKFGLPASSLEPYYPKEGEFFYCETKEGNKIIGCKSDDKPNPLTHILYNSYAISDRLLHEDRPVCEKDSLSLLRPATEEEIQLLKDKVKEKYNKEWNGEEWVEIKKSDNELFEEWKQYYRVSVSSLNQPKFYDKIRAYTELLLFAEWVNQFYERNDYAFLYTHEERLIIELGGNGYVGQIYFHSNKAAQRAIDCLGEELIKTALR